MTPPYVGMALQDVETSFQTCNAVAGEVVYLAMRGRSSCASYEISMSEIAAGSPCTEPPHYTSAAFGNSESTRVVTPLRDRTHQFGSCQAGGWAFFNLEVSFANMHNNMVFELIDDNLYSFDAVRVFM